MIFSLFPLKHSKVSINMARTIRPRPFLFLLFMALSLFAAVSAQAQSLPMPSPPSIAAKSYILLDFHSGRIIAQKNPNDRIPPASMTKLMTLFIVFHELKQGRIHLDDKVTISKKAWHTGGSRMFVKVGSKVSVRDLIKGVTVDSGNDATVALAQYVGGTTGTFVQYMNQFAKQLGMTNTHFENPTGLPHPDHYSSARDLATLARATIKDYPQYMKFFDIKKFTWNGITQDNWNKLLFEDPTVDGMKTGHTEEAGYCLIATAKRHGMRLISVVTHTPSNNARASTSEALLNYGYRFFETRKIYNAGAVVKKLRVWKGASDHVSIGVQKPLYVTVPQSAGKKLDTEVSTPKRIMAPVHSGQQLGTVKVLDDGKVVSQKPLYALQAVKPGGWFKQIWDSIVLFFKNLL